VKDIFISILVFLFVLVVIVATAIIVYSTPDKICQQWEIVPKVFPW
jgi:hypothetical protein